MTSRRPPARTVSRTDVGALTVTRARHAAPVSRTAARARSASVRRAHRRAAAGGEYALQYGSHAPGSVTTCSVAPQS